MAHGVQLIGFIYHLNNAIVMNEESKELDLITLDENGNNDIYEMFSKMNKYFYLYTSLVSSFESFREIIGMYVVYSDEKKLCKYKKIKVPQEKTGYLISSFCNYFEIHKNYPTINEEMKRIQVIRNRFIHMNNKPLFIMGSTGVPIPNHPHYNGWDVDGAELIKKMNYKYISKTLDQLIEMFENILLEVKSENKKLIERPSIFEMPVSFENLYEKFSKRSPEVIGL